MAAPPAPSEVASPRILAVISVHSGDNCHGDNGTHQEPTLASVGLSSEP